MSKDFSKFRISSDAQKQLKEYRSHVIKWNRKISLVSRADPENILDRLINDSLTSNQFLPPEINNLVDIGSGAGLPGVPLAIVNPQRRVILIERSEKKFNFLKNAASRLGLTNLDVINAEYSPEHLPEEGITAVTTLGVGQYIVLIDSLRHKLTGGGGFLFFVNKDFAAELACHVSCETFIWHQISQGTTTGVLWLPAV